MHKVGVCGHFGKEQDLLNGQTVKTKILTEELKRIYGSKEVMTIDTSEWKRNPIIMFIRCFGLIKNSHNLIILPAQNGVKVFLPLFIILSKFFHRKIHYVVVGGWLSMLLETNPWLKNYVKKLNGVYVETHSMKKKLYEQGINNVSYLPNFKKLKILNKNEMKYSKENDLLKLCTFSRVMKEKGIEDAIKSVVDINESLGRVAFSLDIYGEVDKDYSERFNEIQKTFPDYIKYMGVVNFDDSVNVLKQYFALLFPTYYKGEGFAGTILDAFASGTPVIATNWKYNNEIIGNKTDGIIYDYNNPNGLNEVLFEIEQNPDLIYNMKENCLKRAKKYLPEAVIDQLIKNF
jgi:glycosyltransferase involved in cell wall biosynthesis